MKLIIILSVILMCVVIYATFLFNDASVDAKLIFVGMFGLGAVRALYR